MAATKGLSEAQWNFKPATNKWSVAEVTEHIAAAEDLIFSTVTEKVMTAPGRTNTVEVINIDEFVLKQVPDRSHKFSAPEPLQPNNRFGSPEASLKHFEASRAKTIAFMENTKDLRGHAMASPMGEQLDAYEWVALDRRTQRSPYKTN
ncbi:MAG: DinB family protein [Limisphaerales bacterium]